MLDQDVYEITGRFLSSLGYDVVTASQIGLSQADDEELLKVAQEQGRVFITRDRDFGNLVFIKAIGEGVLYLRMLPSTQNAVHKELEKVIKKYSEKVLTKSFVVIEADGHRVRRIRR